MTLRVKIANVQEETPLYTALAKLGVPLRRFPLLEETSKKSGIKSLCVADVPIDQGRFTDSIIAEVLDHLPRRGRTLAYFTAGSIPRDHDLRIFSWLCKGKAPDHTMIKIAFPSGKDKETRILEALFVATQGRGIEKRKLRHTQSRVIKDHDEFAAPVRLGPAIANLVNVTLHRVEGVHIIIAR
ncbi:MAG: hypothetical protein AAB413_04310 [Patescibacteria group bacterium]